MDRVRAIAGWALALAALVALTTGAARALGIPRADLPELIGLLVAVGVVTGGALMLLLRPVVVGRVVGIRGQLLAPVLAVTLLLLALVVAGARQMFISDHDRSVLLTMLLFAGALATGIGWLSAAPIAGRIERLRAATRHLAAGEPAPALAGEGSDELAGLARDFDAMALALRHASDREREMESARRNLIAAVSHDLRAPLAAMRVVVEALADGIVTDDEGRRRYLETAQREISHLGQLVDDLFELAQIDAGVLRLQIEREFARMVLLTPEELARMLAEMPAPAGRESAVEPVADGLVQLPARRGPAAHGGSVEAPAAVGGAGDEPPGFMDDAPDFGGVPDPTLAPGQTRLDAWNIINLVRIGKESGLKLLPVYILQAPDPAWADLPYRSLPEIEISEGPHFGYAVQWFTFAAILGLGYPFFVRRQLRKGADGSPESSNETPSQNEYEEPSNE